MTDNPKSKLEIRLFGFTSFELRCLDALHCSQIGTHYGDGNNCAMHSWKWSDTWAKIHNHINEEDRKVCGKRYLICLLCDDTISKNDFDYHLYTNHKVTQPSKIKDLIYIEYEGNR